MAGVYTFRREAGLFVEDVGLAGLSILSSKRIKNGRVTLSEEELVESIRNLVEVYDRKGISLRKFFSNSGKNGYTVNSSILGTILKNTKKRSIEGFYSAIKSYLGLADDYDKVYESFEDYFESLVEDKDLSDDKTAKNVVMKMITPISLYRLATESVEVDFTTTNVIGGFRDKFYKVNGSYIPKIPGRVLFLQAYALPFFMKLSDSSELDRIFDGPVNLAGSYIVVVFDDPNKTVDFIMKNRYASAVALTEVISKVKDPCRIIVFKHENRMNFQIHITVPSDVVNGLKSMKTSIEKKAYITAKMFSHGKNKLNVIFREVGDADAEAIARLYGRAEGLDDSEIEAIEKVLELFYGNQKLPKNSDSLVNFLDNFDYPTVKGFIDNMSKLSKPGAVEQHFYHIRKVLRRRGGK